MAFSDDEMDLDEVPTTTTTSLPEDKDRDTGKRIVADLPADLDDTLPWVEKYRPSTLDNVCGHQDVIATINKFVETNRLPHLLLYGPPGTGKTSTILALARRIYGAANMRQMVLELNASDDRGIDVVREQIKTFASTKQIFSSTSSTTTTPSNKSLATYKLIILDEADAMTSTAQMALRRIMEKYTSNARFCIIANYTHKLSPALLSRCTRFRFSPLKERDIRVMIDQVIEREGVKIEDAAVDDLVRLSKGDMRRGLNVLQSCWGGARPLPGEKKKDKQGEDVHMEAKDEKEEIEAETITSEAIYTCIASPPPQTIKHILSTLLSTTDVTSCLTTLQQLKQSYGLALADIITALSTELMKVEVPAATRVMWMEGLADVEYRLAGGGAEKVQMGGLVGVVRGGCEVGGM